MKTRLFALCIALLLAGTAFLMGGSAQHTYEEAVQIIGALAENTDPETGVREVTFPLEESSAYRIRRLEDRVEISLLRQELEVSLNLPEGEFPGVYEGQAAEGETLVRFSVDPAVYTEETALSASLQTEPTPEETALLERASLELPELVELTGVLCGSRELIAELNFSSFTRHTYHDYDEGEVTLAPTCAEAGELTRTCRICGQTCTESIAPTGIHSWDKGTVAEAADCYESGVMRYTCAVCGGTRDETIPALGHAWKLQQTISEIQSDANPHGTAAFCCSRCGATKTGARCAGEIFTDMPSQNNWAHAPIEWAYFNGVTAGKTESTFAPGAGCTRAEVMTFLWSAAGKPAPSSSSNPFQDVKPKAYYYQPVLWAVENGVTSGKTASTFAPNDGCTRAEVVTFLWSAAGKPEPESSVNPFRDVKASSYYYKAVLWAVENGITAGKSATAFAPHAKCTRAECIAFLFKTGKLPDCPAVWTQSYPLCLGTEALEGRALCAGNRVYVDKALMEQTFGGSLESDLHWPVLQRLGRDYAALADVAEAFGLGVRFQMEDSTVHLYHLDEEPWTVTEATGNEKHAYLRLEDVTADYGLNKRFTHERLVGLRFFGDFLKAKTDGFYIAWIPCYVNPPEGVVNNIAENYNFYNVDFVFTMDSLILDGGRVGLHGYTHQDNDTVSGVGYEFGPNNEMTEEELMARFTMAEQTAEALGYTWYFFEFPHYSTTELQRSVAEAHFDVIYQPYPDSENPGKIETRTVGSHTCRWIPTPGSYPNGRSDLENFCQKLEKVKYKKQLMSFYFHPYIDTWHISYETDGDVLTCTAYNAEDTVMIEVIRLLTQWGYRIGPF